MEDFPTPKEKPRQLTLDLPIRTQFGREDFLVSASNILAYQQIEAWPDWPNRIMLLMGRLGSGKTHLAHIWQQKSEATFLSLEALEKAYTSNFELYFKSSACFILEDIDQHIIQKDTYETCLFHLFNLIQETKSFLLITARQPLNSWGLRTPDLLSRLRQIPVQLLAEPDESLMRSVLVKLFLDRQLIVDTRVIDYLTRHIDRSLHTARLTVARLDQESCIRRRRITRPLVYTLLKEWEAEAPISVQEVDGWRKDAPSSLPFDGEGSA